MLDIFNNDAFSVRSLTDAINKLKFVPGYLGRSGLFSERGVTTTTIQVEEKDGQLILITPTPRGGPGVTLDRSQRVLRPLNVPHFEINDAVMAESVQNVRAWGTESNLATVQQLVADQMAAHSQSHEATLEYARIGAVKGVITYAGGATTNLFDTFGVSQEAEVDFSLDDAANGVLRKKCASVIRTIAGNLGGLPFTGVGALCGDAFYDDLIANSEVRATYLQQAEASQLRNAGVTTGAEGTFGSFDFGGITWVNYRGAVGNTAFVNTDKCHLYPFGVPGLFRTVFAPADYEETVNTIGQRLYVKQYPMQNGKGRNLDSQTNALSYCTRPKVLMQGKRV